MLILCDYYMHKINENKLISSQCVSLIIRDGIIRKQFTLIKIAHLRFWLKKTE
jgi:hypothetical protein